MDEEGKRVCEGQVLTDSEAISEALLKTGFALEKGGLESGSLSHDLTHRLRE